MSDQFNAGSPPYKRKIGEKEVEFAPLSFADNSDLAEPFYVKARAEKVALLDASLSGLGPEHAAAVAQQKHDELTKFDALYQGDYGWFAFFNTRDGKLKILQKSLENAGHTPSEAQSLARKYAGGDVTQLCAALTYTPLRPTPGGEENPPKPNAEEKSKAFGQE